jgi:hypothetical protein
MTDDDKAASEDVISCSRAHICRAKTAAVDDLRAKLAEAREKLMHWMDEAEREADTQAISDNQKGEAIHNAVAEAYNRALLLLSDEVKR